MLKNIKSVAYSTVMGALAGSMIGATYGYGMRPKTCIIIPPNQLFSTHTTLSFNPIDRFGGLNYQVSVICKTRLPVHEAMIGAIFGAIVGFAYGVSKNFF